MLAGLLRNDWIDFDEIRWDDSTLIEDSFLLVLGIHLDPVSFLRVDSVYETFIQFSVLVLEI